MTTTIDGLEDELRRVAEEVLLGLIGAPALDPASFTVTIAANAKLELACAVRIRGGWNGRVVVMSSRGLADVVAQHMFGRSAGADPERESQLAQNAQDAQDALREIANIVAGNLKPLFGDHNQLGLPEDLPADLSLQPRAAVAQVVIERAEGQLEVRVFETV
jgi:CheY-specific phosphatase CheX